MKPKLPAPIAALIIAAIGGLTNAIGEVHMAHPLHQSLITVAALLAGVVGYLALPAGAPTAAVVTDEGGPPYNIPAFPVPTTGAAAAAAPTRTQIDELAAGERGLP